MVDLKEAEERVILVGVALYDIEEMEHSLEEFKELVTTAGAVSLEMFIQSREQIHPGTYLGKGKLDESLKGTPGYLQFEYVQKELPDLFALCDLVISRAGANAICELLALHKPNLLIPLSANASRGDQILNARSFERQGFSMALEEEELTNETLLSAVHNLYDNREKYIDAMKHSSQQDSIDTIIDLIESVTA